ncbi:hypothetical protein [Sphingobacterium lactis]|uniref:hypothetical protein n=1 Tax=Sphingobacterium lactis TaxID=797291 RepID=UPI0013E0061B|nr:hypothetical protein [Sphingobacterium lactis]
MSLLQEVKPELNKMLVNKLKKKNRFFIFFKLNGLKIPPSFHTIKAGGQALGYVFFDAVFANSRHYAAP